MVSPDALYFRCWRASEGVGWPMYAFKCFLLWGSLSTKPGIKGLADRFSLTPWHKLNLPKLPHPYTPCRRRWFQILAGRSTHSLAPFWWWSALAVTCGKHHEFSTFSVVQFCRPACWLGEAHEKAQKIWLRTSDFVWSWFICCLTKLCRQERSFEAWHSYCAVAFEDPGNNGDFPDTRSTVLWVR